MYIYVKVLNGVGIVTVNDGNGYEVPVLLVGSSIPISAQAGEWVQQFTVYPQEDKNGFVAIAISPGKRKYWECAMVPVFWKGGKLFVNKSSEIGSTAKNFVISNRSGQLYVPNNSNTRWGKMPWIEVQIKDHRYTSNPNRTDSKTHLVTDTDLLCRYLAGQASSDQVIHAAIKDKKENILRVKLETLHAELLQGKWPFCVKLLVANKIRGILVKNR